MVQRIRIRGHVIRTLGVRPSSSRIPPESCPSCLRFYNDDKYRRCIYLCCEFEDCLDCVINQNTFYCEEILDQLKSPRIMPVLNQSEIAATGECSEMDIDETRTPLLHPYDNQTKTSSHVSQNTFPANNISPQNSPQKTSNEITKSVNDVIAKNMSHSGSTEDSHVFKTKYGDLTVILKRLIPKHHRAPVVHVNPCSLQLHRKQQLHMSNGTRKRGRPRKNRNL